VTWEFVTRYEALDGRKSLVEGIRTCALLVLTTVATNGSPQLPVPGSERRTPGAGRRQGPHNFTGRRQAAGGPAAARHRRHATMRNPRGTTRKLSALDTVRRQLYSGVKPKPATAPYLPNERAGGRAYDLGLTAKNANEEEDLEETVSGVTTSLGAVLPGAAGWFERHDETQPALAQLSPQRVMIAVEAIRDHRSACHAGGTRLSDQVGGDLQLGPEVISPDGAHGLSGHGGCQEASGVAKAQRGPVAFANRRSTVASFASSDSATATYQPS
jgi:hypothetical protein